MSNQDHLAPAWEPCGPGCACNDLTLICWGPIDAPEPERDAEPEDFTCHCKAPIGESCITTGELAGCCHETRHRKADAENWKRLGREVSILTGWTIGS